MAKSEKIIISVQLTDKGLKASSSKAKKAVDDVTKSTRQLDKATKDLEFQQTSEAKQLAELKLKAQLTAKANRELALSNLAVANASKQGRTQSGLNNAILTETGRMASDAAYGMQGMANNLGQLMTLMNQHAQTKGGFAASFKELGKSLMGGGGILIGLQLLISFAPKIVKMFDFSSNAVSEFAKELSKLKNEVFANQTVANNYLDVLEDVNSSEKDRKIAIQEVLDIVPSLKEEDLQYGKNLDTVRKEVNKYIKSQVARIEIDQLVQKNSEILGRKMRMDSIRNIEDAQERTEAMNEFLKEEGEGTVEISNKMAALMKIGFGMGASGIKFKEKTGEELTAVWDKMAGLVDKKAPKILKRIDYLRKSLMLEPDPDDKGNGDGSKRVSFFKQMLLNLEKELLKYQKAYKKTNIRNEQEIIKDSGDASIELIEIKRDKFKTDQKLRLKDFIEKQELRKKEKGADKIAIDDSIERAKNRTEESIRLANEEADGVIAAIDKVTEARIANQIRIEELNALKRGSKEEESSDATTIDMMPEGMAKIEAEKALSDLRHSNRRAAAELELEGLAEDSERKRDLLSQMSIWEDERRVADLQSEIDIVNEKQRVNEEYIGFISGLGGILKTLSGESELIRKAALVLEKGAAIASIIGQTTAANANIASQSSEAAVTVASKGWATAAEGSMMLASGNIPQGKAMIAAGAKGVATGAKITAGAAAAMGRNKIGAGISIAAILAESIVGLDSGGSKNSSSGGGGGGGATVQPPDFNIIGSTGTNQLAEAIGTTTKLPIKAYVVSSEVTSAQEMDRNIVQSSSIG